MVDIERIVMVVFYLIIVAAVFGLLWYAIDYIGRNWASGEGGAMFVKFARTVLVVLGVFVAIAVLLSLIGKRIF